MRELDRETLDEAHAAWSSQPLLAFAYGDFQSFAENFHLFRRRAVIDGLAWHTELLATYAEQTASARTRLAKSSYPIRSTNSRAPVVDVVRGQMTLWAYGAVSDFAEAMAGELATRKGVNAIVLRIDSCGGEAASGFELANALLRTRARKLAIVDRACWSAAMLAAVACDRIYVRSSATMMMHQVRLCASGTADDVIARACRARQTDTQYLRFIASRRRASGHRLRELIAKEVFLAPREAIALGLADREIGPLPLVPMHPLVGDLTSCSNG
jgi:ATP-dependent protease ClpP protease subunit